MNPYDRRFSYRARLDDPAYLEFRAELDFEERVREAASASAAFDFDALRRGVETRMARDLTAAPDDLAASRAPSERRAPRHHRGRQRVGRRLAGALRTLFAHVVAGLRGGPARRLAGAAPAVETPAVVDAAAAPDVAASAVAVPNAGRVVPNVERVVPNAVRVVPNADRAAPRPTPARPAPRTTYPAPPPTSFPS